MFIYFFAFVAWLSLAILVWLASALLAILPTTRRMASPLASAMAGTFPGVIAFQLAALPVAAIIVGIALLAVRLIGPNGASGTANPAAVGVVLASVSAMVAVFGGMSLLGFCEGWRAGWLLAKGHHLKSIILRGPSARLLSQFKRHR